MDFHYTFRQGHQDRLEDAGVIQYRPSDGFRVLKPKRENRRMPVRRLHPVVASLINLITR